MKISLIMGTLNRKELVLKAIDSLLSQPHRNFELIVVDQSEVPFPEIKSLDSRIVYIHTNKLGLSHARNIGIKYATGQIIGLMDDDAVYEKTALLRVNRAFSNNYNLVLLSGRLVDPKRITDFGKSSKKGVINWNNMMKKCISACMFFRQDFLETERFDENLGVGCFMGSAEESDIAAKLLKKGLCAMYDDSVVTYHEIPLGKVDIDVEKLRKYSRGFGGFCSKHIFVYHNPFVLMIFVRAMLRTMCGIILTWINNDRNLGKLYRISILERMRGFKYYLNLIMKHLRT